MASKAKSRWAATEEDAELDAQIKREKEEKQRKKAEKAKKLEAERKAADIEISKNRDNNDEIDDGRPSKRRKLTPEPGSGPNDSTSTAPIKLLRFEADSWTRSRSVENYDKLNDIEEGTYGWVARATDRTTGKVVALKRLKLEPGDRNGLPVTGIREIQILKNCRHRNIVTMQEVVVGEEVSKPDKYVQTLSELLIWHCSYTNLMQAVLL